MKIHLEGPWKAKYFREWLSQHGCLNCRVWGLNPLRIYHTTYEEVVVEIPNEQERLMFIIEFKEYIYKRDNDDFH